MPLFGRHYRVTIDTIQIDNLRGEGLRVACRIEKFLDGKKPNTCDLTINNLSEPHIAQLSDLGEVAVKVEAGYDGQLSTLFLGTLRNIRTIDSPPDVITTLTSGDGEKEIRSKRIRKSIQPGTTVDTTLRDLVSALGIGEGNLAKAVALAKRNDLWPSGGVLNGHAADEMNAICRSAGLIWTIHNGALQLTAIDKALDGMAIELSADTGMIEAPSVDAKGILSVKTLLIPDAFPGRKIVMKGRRVKGQYRIETIRFDLDTHGNAWTCEIEGKAY